MKFLLFDIDGTLIDSGGAGVRSLNLAFEEIFGLHNAFRDISMAGKTDLQILREGIIRHGLPYSEETAAGFFDRYLAHLGGQMKQTRGHVKQGVRQALEALKSEERHILGLLTGNIKEGADAKLRNYDLDAYFETGAYGNDSADRNELLPFAVDRLYRSRSMLVSYKDCVVIGDTPKDVECAKAYGAFSIAVATGPYTVDALEKAGADIVFEDFSDTGSFLSAIDS